MEQLRQHGRHWLRGRAVFVVVVLLGQGGGLRSSSAWWAGLCIVDGFPDRGFRRGPVGGRHRHVGRGPTSSAGDELLAHFGVFFEAVVSSRTWPSRCGGAAGGTSPLPPAAGGRWGPSGPAPFGATVWVGGHPTVVFVGRVQFGGGAAAAAWAPLVAWQSGRRGRRALGPGRFELVGSIPMCLEFGSRIVSCDRHWLVASCDRHWLVLRLVDVVLATGWWLASLRGGDWPCELAIRFDDRQFCLPLVGGLRRIRFEDRQL